MACIADLKLTCDRSKTYNFDIWTWRNPLTRHEMVVFANEEAQLNFNMELDKMLDGCVRV